MSKLAQYNKSIVAVLGLILLVGSDVVNNLNNLLPAQWIVALNVALGLMTAFLTFWVKNEQLVEDVAHDVQSPSLPGGIDAVSKMTELAAGIRADVADVKSNLHRPYTLGGLIPSPTPREAAPVSVVVNTPAAATTPVAVEPAPVPQPEPAPTGTYPAGPYVPPEPAYTGPIPPVSEPVGATAVSAAP